MFSALCSFQVCALLHLPQSQVCVCVLVCVPPLLALCCVRSFELVLVNPHENIVSVYGICTDAPDGNLRIVMRLCVKSVWDLLQQHRARVSVSTSCRGQVLCFSSHHPMDVFRLFRVRCLPCDIFPCMLCVAV